MQCSVCFNTTFVELGGIYTCEACGTQTQDFVEENEIAEEGGAALHSRIRSAAAPSVRALRAEVDRALVKPETTENQMIAGAKTIARVYVACLQELLRAQVDVLVSRYGLPAELHSLARHLWLSYLPHTPMLDFDPRTLSEAARLFSQDEDGVWQQLPNSTRASILATGFSNTMRGDALHSMQLHKWHEGFKGTSAAVSVLRKALPPSSTLAVCYLACLILRHPTDPWDITRWALDGHLPFLDLYQRSLVAGLLTPAFMTEALSEADLARVQCTEDLLRLPSIVPDMRRGFWSELLGNAVGLPTAQSLGLYTLALSSRLQLRLPDVPAELLLLRYARELRLPQAVGLVACEVHKLYLMASPALTLAGLPRNSDPYVNLLALIYLATKLCYGLDGCSTPRLPHVPQMVHSWTAWADALARVWGHATQFPITPEEVCSMSSEQQAAYLRYVAEMLLTHAPSNSTIADIVSQLAGMASGIQTQPTEESHTDGGRDAAVLVPAFGAPAATGAASCDALQGAGATQTVAGASGNGLSEPAASGSSSAAGHRYARVVSVSGLTHVDSLAVLTVCCLRCGVHHEVMLNAVESIEEAMALSERVLLLEEHYMQHALGPKHAMPQTRPSAVGARAPRGMHAGTDPMQLDPQADSVQASGLQHGDMHGLGGAQCLSQDPGMDAAAEAELEGGSLGPSSTQEQGNQGGGAQGSKQRHSAPLTGAYVGAYG